MCIHFNLISKDDYYSYKQFCKDYKDKIISISKSFGQAYVTIKED